MYVTRENQIAEISRRMRALIAKRGVSPNGHPLWSAEEDKVVRNLYPDYPALVRALPRRTRTSIQWRSQVLGMTINNPMRFYTAKEESEFRKAYTRDTTQVLRERFPHRSPGAMEKKAAILGLRRPRPPYRHTGNYLLDALRARCHAEQITMADLDEFAKSGKYFNRHGWGGKRGPFNYRHIIRAIHELGGKLRIEWGDE